MRLLLFVGFLFAVSAAPAQEVCISCLVTDMAKKDRLERMRAAQSVQEKGRQAPETLGQWRRVATLDSLHGRALYRLKDTPGFKKIMGMGGETAHALWLLVMHQDDLPELQSNLLRVMHQEKQRGNIILRDMAFLEDRIAVNNGEPQTYGTQTYYDEQKDRYVPFEIEPKGLKDRRRSVSLKPLKQQLKEENKRHKVKF